MSIYGPHYYEQEDREAELEKVRRLIHRERNKEFQDVLEAQSKGYDEWAKEECKQGRHEFSGGQCVHCGEMDRKGEYPNAKRGICVNFSNPQNVSEKWAKLFLYNWDRAVKLCNSWDLFMPEYSQWRGQVLKLESQQEYARICQSWLAPNGCADPHIEADNISSECSCPHCLLELCKANRNERRATVTICKGDVQIVAEYGRIDILSCGCEFDTSTGE